MLEESQFAALDLRHGVAVAAVLPPVLHQRDVDAFFGLAGDGVGDGKEHAPADVDPRDGQVADDCELAHGDAAALGLDQVRAEVLQRHVGLVVDGLKVLRVLGLQAPRRDLRAAEARGAVAPPKSVDHLVVVVVGAAFDIGDHILELHRVDGELHVGHVARGDLELEVLYIFLISLLFRKRLNFRN